MSLSLPALYGVEVKMTAVFVAGDEKKDEPHAMHMLMMECFQGT
jgi:hypothetical protein